MQKISYEEAREWFWIRAAVWFVPTAIVSVMACFAYFVGVDEFKTRMLYAIAAGVGSTLFGLIAAGISIQFPWMRFGWRTAWLPNLVVCALVATTLAVLVCSVIVSVTRDNISNPMTEEAMAAAYDMMLFAIYLSGGWGIVLGGWFALRRDKYFVEAI